MKIIITDQNQNGVGGGQGTSWRQVRNTLGFYLRVK